MEIILGAIFNPIMAMISLLAMVLVICYLGGKY